MAVQTHPETQSLRDAEKPAVCAHCASPIPTSARSTLYCCTGCEAVATLLKSEGLERYYTMAQAQVLPVGEVSGTRTHTWLVPLVERAESSAGLCTMELDVQGIHCAGCVWLMNEVFRRSKAQGSIIVNPGLGKGLLRWERGHFSPEAFVKHIESFGYLFGPARKNAAQNSRELTARLGISAALTINVMLFSVAMYFGLSQAEPEIHTLFSRLSLVLSSLTVLVGGWPFFRSALRGLKTGLLHLDLPIALGIALVYGVTLLQYVRDENTQTYLDTLNTFITLMLVGRWLQERVLDRNRRMLLDDDGADGLVVRRIDGDDVQVVPAN